MKSNLSFRRDQPTYFFKNWFKTLTLANSSLILSKFFNVGITSIDRLTLYYIRHGQKYFRTQAFHAQWIKKSVLNILNIFLDFYLMKLAKKYFEVFNFFKHSRYAIYIYWFWILFYLLSFGNILQVREIFWQYFGIHGLVCFGHCLFNFIILGGWFTQMIYKK